MCCFCNTWFSLLGIYLISFTQWNNYAMRDHNVFRCISVHLNTPQPTRIFWLNLLCVFFECRPSVSPILFIGKVHMWQVSLLKCCRRVKRTNYLSRRLWKDCVGRISDSLLITLPCCLLLSLYRMSYFIAAALHRWPSQADTSSTGNRVCHLWCMMHMMLFQHCAALKLWTADAFDTVWSFLWLKCINSLYNILELQKTE